MKAANTYWIDNRLNAQRVNARAAVPSFNHQTTRELSRELIGTRTEVRLRGGIIPSWVAFATIILATFALCVTVTMRAQAEMRVASQVYEKANADVEQLRNSNATLETEVRRLKTEPRAIEAAARTRLNMIRANEIIVPVQ
ncbi:MAG: septum formation initiator family protein [Pyrinomonadaceae bacterium]